MTCLAFSPDGRVLVVPHVIEGLALWDPSSGRRLATLAEPRSPVLSLTFSPDGRTLAAGTAGGGIELWDLATRQRPAEFRGHSSSVWGLAFLPDGQSLVSGGHDGRLRCWEMSLLPRAIEGVGCAFEHATLTHPTVGRPRSFALRAAYPALVAGIAHDAAL